MLNDKENTYLAKWLNDDLSSEELEELKQLPEYKEYKKIVDGLTYFKAPPFDVQPSLATTLGKIYRPKEAKVINLKPVVYTIAAAASIILIIGIFFNKVTYTTNQGEQLAVVLPDGSAVDLNASSTLTHQRFFWSSNRKINLLGEAHFKVSSGATFTVTTKLGKIEVLGTQFNIKDRTNEFIVDCYEGKVKVSTHDNQQKVLQKGEGVFLKNNQLIEETVSGDEPMWKKGESIFNSVPLKNVLDELERQYKVVFKRNQIDQKQLFTGGFNYQDLTIALESVLVPMGVGYVVNGSNISLSTQ
ncbi:FecR family protein [Aquimarina aquimarini]|uniref:FecR family protein n=1 Tax=Aquimarina aquimarini TaxID=1191734 RepID=UPI000D54C00C|nr:FecR family protein [Aquimarina aquimarini]